MVGRFSFGSKLLKYPLRIVRNRVVKQALKICDPLAWLSELYKQREYIGLAIENLNQFMNA
jgi:hypothetical protein